MSDDSNSWVAELDQIKAGLHDLAGMLAQYYGDLLEARFTAEQAFALVLAYQTGMQQAAK